MIVEKDVPIVVADGNVLRANVYRPAGDGRFPVIMAQGVYGKDTHFADAFPTQYAALLVAYPDLCRNGSSGRYLRWEVVDPERFVPDGYAVVHVDSRGTGKSPGYLDPRSPLEIRDYYDAIEWAAMQTWSNGRVGLAGVSYYAYTQWAVAALQPPHLAAIMPWEGLTDYYRDSTRHGGIFSNAFTGAWWPRQVIVNQHGNGSTRYRDRETDEPPTGPPLGEMLLAANRVAYMDEYARHPLDDAWYQERTADLSRVVVPVFSAGNWGGPGLHLRGNVEGFLRSASRHKWLSMHIGTHWESFYLPKYVAMQKQFFGHFLKGENNGWERRPPVLLAVRTVDGGALDRTEDAFPIGRTHYTRFYLDANARTLTPHEPQTASRVTYAAMGEGIDFSTAPLERAIEWTGFVTARLFVASSTVDMDIFAVLRVFDRDDREVSFTGAHERTPLARGWLRVSHRQLDADRSLPYRPFRAHTGVEPMAPGDVYPVDIEIWPTSIVLEPGYRLVLTILGKDFEYPGIPGRLLHNDPHDRDPAIFAGDQTILTGGPYASYLLMPQIPEAAP